MVGGESVDDWSFLDARRLNSKLGFRHLLFLCSDLCGSDGLEVGRLPLVRLLLQFGSGNQHHLGVGLLALQGRLLLLLDRGNLLLFFLGIGDLIGEYGIEIRQFPLVCRSLYGIQRQGFFQIDFDELGFLGVFHLYQIYV